MIKKIVGFLVVLIFSGGSGLASASFVSASGDMEISDLRFSSSNPAAILMWTDNWYGSVFSEAHDSDSGFIDDFDDLLGNNGLIDTQSTTAHASSDATYGVINGGAVAKDSSASIDASTHAEILLNEAGKHADGFSITDFDNFFIVTGGNAGDAVEVTFELDYIGQLTGDADDEGFFESIVGAFISIEDDFGNLLSEDFIFDDIFGTDTSLNQNYTGTLTVAVGLHFEEDYWLYSGAGSEVYAETIPEPNVFLLMMSGLGFLVWNNLKKKQISL